MAIEQTSAISALTKVTNRDPKELTAPVRDKKVQAEEKAHFRRVNFRSSCLRRVKTTLILHGWQKLNRR